MVDDNVDNVMCCAAVINNEMYPNHLLLLLLDKYMCLLPVSKAVQLAVQLAVQGQAMFCISRIHISLAPLSSLPPYLRVGPGVEGPHPLDLFTRADKHLSTQLPYFYSLSRARAPLQPAPPAAVAAADEGMSAATAGPRLDRLMACMHVRT